MADQKIGEEIKYSLAQIQITHPETNEVLMMATPTPGSNFDLQLPEGISKEDLVIVASQLVEFHYRHTMEMQRALAKMGWGPKQISDLFFPGVPDGTPT